MILNLSKEIEEYVVDIYKHLHENPELGGKEENTMFLIEHELNKMNIKHKRIPKGGIIAKINPGKSGKKVALRADIDALPMSEDKNNLIREKLCCSKINNISHTCGHDGHTSMLLGAAKLLQGISSNIPGEVLLVFEQGEEIGYGMKSILKEILLEKPDTIWGIHLQSATPSGKISVDSGARMSSVVPIAAKIIGKSGHGSRPDLSKNPLDCFMDIYSQLKNVRMDYTSPFHAATFNIGKVNMGNVGNIIPDSLEFYGTFRYTDSEQGHLICKRVSQIYDTVPKVHGCKLEILRKPNTTDMSVYNNPQCSKIAEDAIVKVLGREVLLSREPWMASESFGIYQKYVPGVFAFLGINNPEKGTGGEHHNSNFEIDTDVLKLGVLSTAQYTLDFMNSNLKIDFKPLNLSPDDFLK